MELAYANLSRYAEVNQDGTFTLLGFDFDTLKLNQVPSQISIFLVIKIDYVASEFGDNMDTLLSLFELDVIGPDGLSVIDTPVVNPQGQFDKKVAAQTYNSNRRDLRLLVCLSPLKISKVGEYRINFKVILNAVTVHLMQVSSQADSCVFLRRLA